MFYFPWPSWCVELLGGATLALVACIAMPSQPGALGVATLVSVVYERWLDVNGWSWRDVAQRECGVMLGLTLCSLLTF